MRPLVPIAMTALILIGASMGDDAPFLNAYELLRSSGLASLPQVGTRYLADQEKLGRAALPMAWAAWIFASMLVSYLVTKAWDVLH